MPAFLEFSPTDVSDFAEMSTCERCGLAATRQRVVIGTGPLDARLMIIGEAPGRTEDEGGAPFIGRSGKLFFQLLEEEVGLDAPAVLRHECGEVPAPRESNADPGGDSPRAGPGSSNNSIA